MNLLDLCNEVLVRMREDPMATAVGNLDNEAHKLCIKFVNDAKGMVEDAWTWTALTGHEDVSILAAPGAPAENFTLPRCGDQARIENIWAKGDRLIPITRDEMFRLRSTIDPADPQHGTPMYYAVTQTSPSVPVAAGFRDVPGDILISVWPWSKDAWNGVASFTIKPTPLVNDVDVLEVPYAPVLAYAIALMSRERGEVNGQTSTELFGFAKTILADAIAIDANNHAPELIWSVV